MLKLLLLILSSLIYAECANIKALSKVTGMLNLPGSKPPPTAAESLYSSLASGLNVYSTISSATDLAKSLTKANTYTGALHSVAASAMSLVGVLASTVSNQVLQQLSDIYDKEASNLLACYAKNPLFDQIGAQMKGMYSFLSKAEVGYLKTVREYLSEMASTMSVYKPCYLTIDGILSCEFQLTIEELSQFSFSGGVQFMHDTSLRTRFCLTGNGIMVCSKAYTIVDGGDEGIDMPPIGIPSFAYGFGIFLQFAKWNTNNKKHVTYFTPVVIISYLTFPVGGVEFGKAGLRHTTEIKDMLIPPTGELSFVTFDIAAKINALVSRVIFIKEAAALASLTSTALKITGTPSIVAPPEPKKKKFLARIISSNDLLGSPLIKHPEVFSKIMPVLIKKK